MPVPNQDGVARVHNVGGPVGAVVRRARGGGDGGRDGRRLQTERQKEEMLELERRACFCQQSLMHTYAQNEIMFVL